MEKENKKIKTKKNSKIKRLSVQMEHNLYKRLEEVKVKGEEFKTMNRKINQLLERAIEREEIN